MIGQIFSMIRQAMGQKYFAMVSDDAACRSTYWILTIRNNKKAHNGQAYVRINKMFFMIVPHFVKVPRQLDLDILKIPRPAMKSGLGCILIILHRCFHRVVTWKMMRDLVILLWYCCDNVVILLWYCDPDSEQVLS